MSVTTKTTDLTQTRAVTLSPKSVLLRLVNGLLDADARYREKQRMSRMDEDRLADMGLERDFSGNFRSTR